MHIRVLFKSNRHSGIHLQFEYRHMVRLQWRMVFVCFELQSVDGKWRGVVGMRTLRSSALSNG